MDPEIEVVLKRMGWTSGLHLPVANEENKALQLEVERLMIQKAKTVKHLENETERFNSISNHLKFVKNQTFENQNLLSTYRQHLDSQEHKFLLTQSENSRVKQEIRQIEKQIDEVETRSSNKKNDLNRSVAKTEKAKIETLWDNEALKAWDDSLKKRDEDNELLKKFSLEDEKKAKELEAKRQNLQVESLNRRGTLDKVVSDVTNYEHILERIGKIFQQQKEERVALTIQWQEAAKTLRRRDNDLDKMIQDITEMQNLLQQKQEHFNEQNAFYLNETKNNKELEFQIDKLNFSASKIRSELNELIQYVFTLISEANTLKRNLISSSNYLEKERLLGRNLENNIQDKDCKIFQSKANLLNLQQKLDEVLNTSASSADRARQFEQIIEEEQRNKEILHGDIERMQGVLFRTRQVFNELTNSSKIKELAIGGCETAKISLEKRLKQVLNEIQKQKEINYGLDFNINKMESKLYQLEGQAIDENKQEREDRIIELENISMQENETKHLLQTQVTQIEDEMRRLTMSLNNDSKQMNILQDKLQDEVLQFEGGLKVVAVTKQNVQQTQVNENILRLKVTQMENVMKHEDHNIFNLQRYQIEIEAAMRERQIQIVAHRDILSSRRRSMEEEKSRLKKDISGRHVKIEQLQARFQIAISALGKDEHGQPLSVTHFKIKNAQEKYMLEQEGDELDAKVKKAEKEIIAMENTFRIVNLSNVNYRQSLTRIEDFDEEAREMELLKSELETVTKETRKKKRELHQKKLQLTELQDTLQQADEEKLVVRQQLATIENEYADLQRHEATQIERLDRTDRHLHSCMKNLDPRQTQKYRKNLLIRQLQEANKNALQQLSDTSAKHLDMTPHIKVYIANYNLQLPAGPKITFSPSTSSTASSRSSVYYESGAYVSNLLLTFDPNSSGLKNATTKKVSQRRTREGFNVYNKY